MGTVVVVVIGFGIAALFLGLADGSIHVNTGLLFGGAFAVGVLFLLGGIIARDNSQARRINGEIEGRLQHFANKRAKAYGCKNYWHVVDCVNAEEAKFRQTIEYGVVTDGSENLYSYKERR